MSDQDLAAQLREQARSEGWQAGYSASEETYTMLRIHARAAEAEIERLTAALAAAQQETAQAVDQLAECYALSGAEPEGERWRDAPYAVEHVRRLRADHDIFEERCDKAEYDLATCRQALAVTQQTSDRSFQREMADGDKWRLRAEAAEAERDRLRAALKDLPRYERVTRVNCERWAILASDLDAVLAATEPPR